MRQGRAEIADVAEDEPEQQRGEDRPGQLAQPVARDPSPWEQSLEREGEGDRRVEVGARGVTKGVDERPDEQARRD
ncbi:MAG TPA: hypothetical protein VEY67_12295, partial [Candidatus Dormibacteraeota bacterium]|nr:hypothetical protein [Candidatus Dormibacteraeota bacterium]